MQGNKTKDKTAKTQSQKGDYELSYLVTRVLVVLSANNIHTCPSLWDTILAYHRYIYSLMRLSLAANNH